MSDEQTPAPLFSVVKGHPTDEELAAVVAVLTGLPRGSTRSSKVAPSGWSAYWRTVRPPLTPGSGAWIASARR